MPLEIDGSLPASLVPLQWLVGRWAGAGVMASPETGETQVGQEVDVVADERGFLAWTSRVWRLDAEGRRTDALDTETGYWRTSAEQSSPGKPGVDVELLLAHPTGVVEVLVGRIVGTRVEMVTDAVVRTAGASDYTAGKRTFGQVEGDLLWVLDVASSTQQLHPRLSARSVSRAGGAVRTPGGAAPRRRPRRTGPGRRRRAPLRPARAARGW